MSAPSTPTRSVSEKVRFGAPACAVSTATAAMSSRTLRWAWEGPFLPPAMLPHALEDSTLVRERPPFSVPVFSGRFPP